MKIFLLTLIIIIFAVIGLSIGMIINKRKLKRSCEARRDLMNNHSKCDSCSCGRDD